MSASRFRSSRAASGGGTGICALSCYACRNSPLRSIFGFFSYSLTVIHRSGCRACPSSYLDLTLVFHHLFLSVALPVACFFCFCFFLPFFLAVSPPPVPHLPSSNKGKWPSYMPWIWTQGIGTRSSFGCLRWASGTRPSPCLNGGDSRCEVRPMLSEGVLFLRSRLQPTTEPSARFLQRRFPAGKAESVSLVCLGM